MKIAVIAGAGPAGLTTALELLRRSDVTPIIFEADTQVGGISKTINYRGNRMDLGGHRFFSKSDWVMRWWQEILPIAESDTRKSGENSSDLRISYQGQSRILTPEAHPPFNSSSSSNSNASSYSSPNSNSSSSANSNASANARADTGSDAVLLIRQRLSRIFYGRRFFDYPLALNANTLQNLGALEALKIGLSYGRARLTPRMSETSLEDFFINRFGNRLYQTFFRDYTEKVWGVPCTDISAEWGAQRIKGLSVSKAIGHALSRPFRHSSDAAQRQTETSLIERFLYPKLGPGQMWEEVARRISERGGKIYLRHRIVGIEHAAAKVSAVTVLDEETGLRQRVACDHFISTMPISDLIACLQPPDSQVQRIASQLPYRDFMTVGLLLKRMNSTGGRGITLSNGMPPDNWIYIQDADVRIGRLQVFNNWSPAMVADPSTIWLGLEYFCREGDDLWCMEDGRFVDFAASELEKIGLLDRKDVLDGTLVRVRKAYPAYFGAYAEFDRIKAYLDPFTNLYPVGRNGMHRYNNQDHSMLAAKCAVDSIIGTADKRNIWSVNAEDEYHEQRSAS